MRKIYSFSEKVEVLLQLMSYNFHNSYKEIDLRYKDTQKKLLNILHYASINRNNSHLFEKKNAAQKMFNIYNENALLNFFSNPEVYKIAVDKGFVIHFPLSMKVVCPKNDKISNYIIKCSPKFRAFASELKHFSFCKEDIINLNNCFVIRNCDGKFDPLFVEANSDTDLITSYTNQ